MKCVFCGGRIEQRNTRFVYEDENRYFFVENVPAEVCTQCGEKTYSPEVSDCILQFGKNESEQVKIVRVPVFDYLNVESVSP